MIDSAVQAPNLHHYNLNVTVQELANRLKDVRFLLVAGSAHRIEAQAAYLRDQNILGPAGSRVVETLSKAESRFRLIKIGCCLLSDHGMGSASMSIALHELFLMCRFAAVLNNITLIRFGTCGGIGVPGGTVCLTRRAMDSMFQDFVELKICGKLVRRACIVDQTSVDQYERVALRAMTGGSKPKETGDDFLLVSGGTVATNDFYEEQGRTNGAICEHSDQDKMRFLQRAASQFGVVNMEMESNHLAAMSHKCGLSFLIVCVALNNRLESDRVDLTGDQMAQFERRLFWLNAQFIKDRLVQAS